MRSTKTPTAAVFTGKPERAAQSQHLADLLTAYQHKPFAPGVYAVLVRHDAWCRLLNNRGPCNCHPDIEIR